MNPGDPLPDGWIWTTLGDVCAINPRRPKELDLAPHEMVTFVPMAAVDEDQASIARPQTRPYAEVARGYTYMQEGDVIFAKITPCMQNGKHAILRETLSGIAFGSTEFHVLRPSVDVDPIWVHRFLLRQDFLEEAERNFTGTAGQRRVPKQFLADAVIPLPPLAEQRRIVAELETRLAAAEHARLAAQAQLAALDAMPGALLRKVFDATPRSRSWRRVALGEMLAVADSGVWGDEHAQGVSVLRSTNFQNDGTLNLDKLTFRNVQPRHRESKQLRPGDILLERSGGGPTQPVGRVCLFEGDDREHIFGNFCQRLRADESICRSRYLFRYLYWFHLRGGTERFQNRTTGIRNLQYKRYVAQDVPVPPLDEQDRIVAEIEHQNATTERAREAAQARLDAAEALAGAILRRAFSPEAP